jgi:hypothetical protein
MLHLTTLNIFLFSASTAFAQDSVEPPVEKKLFSVSEFRLALRGVGEAWKEPAISQVYRNSRFLGSVGFDYRFHPNLTSYFEAGYTRVDGNDGQTAFQIVPTSFGVSGVFGNSTVEPFAGLGLSLVSFSEELPTGGVTGTKIGTDFRLGARVGTRAIQPSQHPNGPKGPSQMDIEFMVGGRVHHAFGIGQGFDLGAFRVGLGAVFRF